MFDAKGAIIVKNLEKIREEINLKFRTLRLERNFTQKELSKKIGLSQSRLSEIERGKGSFTAEQFIVILKFFNVSANYFISHAELDTSQEIQSALARLGGKHLFESTKVFPSEQLDNLSKTIREVLVHGTPRFLTALGPVLVENIDTINLHNFYRSLSDSSLERRFAWLIENIYESISILVESNVKQRIKNKLKRTEVVMGNFLDLPYNEIQNKIDKNGSDYWDIISTDIRSKKTLVEIKNNLSNISMRWRIVSTLFPSDFEKVLRVFNDS